MIVAYRRVCARVSDLVAVEMARMPNAQMPAVGGSNGLRQSLPPMEACPAIQSVLDNPGRARYWTAQRCLRVMRQCKRRERRSTGKREEGQGRQGSFLVRGYLRLSRAMTWAATVLVNRRLAGNGTTQRTASRDRTEANERANKHHREMDAVQMGWDDLPVPAMC